MISFQDISKVYPSNSGGAATVALDGVSFDIGEQEFVSFVGRSGAGKTTLLKLLLVEEHPTKGKILFDGYDVHTVKPRKLYQLRRRIGTVFQDYKLFPLKTAFENVAYVLEVMGASDQEVTRDVSQVLEIVGLSDRADNFPRELSGGERQRVAIARALVHQPDVILADEPTGNLDPYNAFEIIKLLVRIYEFGTTVLLATHNKDIINSLGKRVITLENGGIVRDQKRGRFIL